MRKLIGSCIEYITTLIGVVVLLLICGLGGNIAITEIPEAVAWMSPAVVGGGIPSDGGGYSAPSTSTSYWNFEDNTDCTTGLPADWSFTDDSTGTDNCHDATAEYAGTYGLSVELEDSTESYAVAKYDPVGAESTISMGMWIYVPTTTDADWNFYCLQGDGTDYRTYLGRDGTGYYFKPRASTTGSYATYVTPDAWYWLCGKFVQNSTFVIRVYNTSGTIQQNSNLDDESTCNTADVTVNASFFGKYASNTINEDGTYIFVDDCYIDFTGTWPYVPSSW